MKDLLYIILLASTIFAITFWLIFEYQNWRRKSIAKKERHETKYHIMYLNIEAIIDLWQVNEKSYNAILVFFGKIYEHQGKTKWMIERTHTLYNRFVDKYIEFGQPDEFSPESIFSEYDRT